MADSTSQALALVPQGGLLTPIQYSDNTFTSIDEIRAYAAGFDKEEALQFYVDTAKKLKAFSAAAKTTTDDMRMLFDEELAVHYPVEVDRFDLLDGEVENYSADLQVSRDSAKRNNQYRRALRENLQIDDDPSTVAYPYFLINKVRSDDYNKHMSALINSAKSAEQTMNALTRAMITNISRTRTTRTTDITVSNVKLALQNVKNSPDTAMRAITRSELEELEKAVGSRTEKMKRNPIFCSQYRIDAQGALVEFHSAATLTIDDPKSPIDSPEPLRTSSPDRGRTRSGTKFTSAFDASAAQQIEEDELLAEALQDIQN